MSNLFSYEIIERILMFLDQKETLKFAKICPIFYKYYYIYRLNNISKKYDINTNNKIIINLDIFLTGPLFIMFGNRQNYYIEQVSSCISLTIHDIQLFEFNGIMSNELHIPNNIITLTYGDYFNSNYKIPQSVEHVIFGNNFNQELNDISLTLQSLTLGKSFNKSIEDILPKLKKLTYIKLFNLNYNHPIQYVSDILSTISFCSE